MKFNIQPFVNLEIMKSHLLYLFLLFLFLGCSKMNDPEVVLEVLTNNNIILEEKKDSKVVIDFTASCDWKASIDVDWAILDKTKGNSGRISLGLISKSDNLSGDIRTGKITITSLNVTKTLKFEQKAQNVLNILTTDLNFNATDVVGAIKFETNITDYILNVRILDSLADWINISEKDLVRTNVKKELQIDLQPNFLPVTRKVDAIIQLLDKNNKENILIESKTFTIIQGAYYGYSSDYSKDKEVSILRKHTKGSGIPIIFMGDGFLDIDIDRGYYDEVINKSVDYFFSEEPIKSMSEFFDLYMIRCVSMRNVFNQNNTTFSCWLEGNNSTLIKGENLKVAKYAEEALAKYGKIDLLNEALCIVVLNTYDYAGTCYFGFEDAQTGDLTELAIGYCPTINGVNDEMFRRVLTHECVGHGFAKLLDEYSYQDMGEIPSSLVTEYRRLQETVGWYSNVSFTGDLNNVLWNEYLNDDRYKSADNYGEVLGAYLGACTYWTGAWRPTNESMMRSNKNGFNVPSREAIYKRVMKLAFGKEWEFEKEEFIKFDQLHLPTPANDIEETRGHFNIVNTYPPIYTGEKISFR